MTVSDLDVALVERDGLADALEKEERTSKQLREVALAAARELGPRGRWAVESALRIGRYRG